MAGAESDVDREVVEEPTKQLTLEEKRSFNSKVDIRTNLRREFSRLYNATTKELETWYADSATVTKAEATKATLQRLAAEMAKLDESITITVALTQSEKLPNVVERINLYAS